MSAFLSPVSGAAWQFFDNNGIVLAGGKLYTYLAGTTTNQSTWTDSTQVTLNANPIILNSAGRMTSEVWLQGGSSYKFVLADSNNNIIGTYDNISGLNDANYNPFSEWITYGVTPTYISSTQFSVPGNQTNIFQIGRRVQYVLGSGTFYGSITNSVFSAGVTVITISADTTGLDATLTSVAYGFMSAVNNSLPVSVYAPIASPTFTGTPSGPTAPAGTSTIQFATTQFVGQAIFNASFPSTIDASWIQYGINVGMRAAAYSQ